MRFVVSGAAGFVPSHLCDLILQEGHQVVGVDNFLTGNIRNIAHLRDNENFQFVEADVCQPLPDLGSVDCVIHAASPASPKDYYAYPIETLDVGSIASRNLLELARANGARYLVTSTSECYGDPLEHPQVETYWGNVNPVGPRSCYDESKRFAEAIAMAYHRKYGLRTNIARIFNTYGPRMKLDDGRVVPQFLDQALQGKPITVYGDGSQTRSFCFVSDLVRGLFLLSQSEERFPVNLGNPVERSMLQFAEVILAQTGSASEIVFEPLPQDDPKRRKPDISKAKRVLGWEPRISLEEGLKPTIAYFQSIQTGAIA
ncbi:MAG TPA: UDP-glucuronic acid decarboxylase family protein [Bryobacteraceae bacterium]|nr:UDP-glucuronic acid decarboxylase family protein [Bryobacteraceae bacterium]